MYLRTLLFLALCFQAFHTGNSVRMFDKIHGGLEMGKALKVEVYDPESYPEFHVRLFSYNVAREVSDIGLSLKINVTATHGELVLSSKIKGAWLLPYRSLLERAPDPHRMVVEIAIEETNFDIAIFDQQETWNYVVPTEKLNYWEIEYRQEYVLVSPIWYRKYTTCKQCSLGTYNNIPRDYYVD